MNAHAAELGWEILPTRDVSSKGVSESYTDFRTPRLKVKAYHVPGLIYLREGEYDVATRSFARALILNPELEVVHAEVNAMKSK